jgi:hypothetical protein
VHVVGAPLPLVVADVEAAADEPPAGAVSHRLVATLRLWLAADASLSS